MTVAVLEFVVVAEVVNAVVVILVAKGVVAVENLIGRCKTRVELSVNNWNLR